MDGADFHRQARDGRQVENGLVLLIGWLVALAITWS